MMSIAIIGASSDRKKFGNKAVRAFAWQGYTVYPVNPKEAQIESLPRSKASGKSRPGRIWSAFICRRPRC